MTSLQKQTLSDASYGILSNVLVFFGTSEHMPLIVTVLLRIYNGSVVEVCRFKSQAEATVVIRYFVKKTDMESQRCNNSDITFYIIYSRRRWIFNDSNEFYKDTRYLKSPVAYNSSLLNRPQKRDYNSF